MTTSLANSTPIITFKYSKTDYSSLPLVENFYNKNPSIPYFRVEKKFDKIKFNVKLNNENSHLKTELIKFLRKKYKLAICKPSDSDYLQMLYNKRITILYFPDYFQGNGFFKPYFKIKIEDPSAKEVMEIIEFCWKYNGSVKIKQFEIVWDFFGENRIELQQFLDSHHYHPFSSTNPFRYLGTRYSCDFAKKFSRGFRSYHKKELDTETEECVRLEEVVNRRRILDMEKSGNYYPYLPSDFDDDFEFRILNEKTVRKYLRKKYILKHEGEIEDKDLLEKEATEFVESFFIENPSLQERYWFLKKLDAKNAGRFLLPFPELKDALFSPSTDDSPPIPSPTPPTPINPFVFPPGPLLDRIGNRGYLHRQHFFNSS